MKKFVMTLGLIGAIAAGCAKQSGNEQAAEQSNAAPPVKADQFLSGEEPADAKTVIEVREAAKTDDDVVIVGRIGGSENPWVAGRAMFTIVDQSRKACSDIEGDECPTPWDYCCDNVDIDQAMATVKFVDDDGKLIEQGAKEWLNLTELQTVVVEGKAKRDDAGNLVVVAKRLFAKK